MPQQKLKKELADEAVILATSFALVRHKGIIYIPADYETGDTSVTPPDDRKIWLPLNLERLRRVALKQFDTLFQDEASLRNFAFMVEQCSDPVDVPARTLLIRTPDGLRELRDDGQLHDPTGSFVPNALPVMLNPDPKDKAEIMSVVSEWVDGEEEAVSLLRHCATALAPHWSAVKYVLLIGDGRNGKSMMLSMLERVFGSDNCAHVTRQDMSQKNQQVMELQGRLVNIVYDGLNEYLKDSANEKSLVAGEPVGVRPLYRTEQMHVQTNALFIEGLNQEPKSKDKSSALQARLSRFWFPNVYPLNQVFHEHMLSDRMVGALLSVLIDHYVPKAVVAEMLAPTSRAVELRMEHMIANSLAIQFLVMTEEKSATGVDVLINVPFSDLTAMFKQWRIAEKDYGVWSDPDIIAMFRPLITSRAKSERIANHPYPVKVRRVTGFTQEIRDLIYQHRAAEAAEEEEVTTDVVAD